MFFWRPNWDIIANKVNEWLIQHIMKPHCNCSCINGEEEECGGGGGGGGAIA